METNDSWGHPLSSRSRRRRPLAIMFEAALIVVISATVLASSVSGTSWWYVLPISFALLFGAVFHLYAVVGFNLDETCQPITGRDADQFALWKLDRHRRGN